MKIIPQNSPPCRWRICAGLSVCVFILISVFCAAGLQGLPIAAHSPSPQTLADHLKQLGSDRWYVRSKAQQWLLRRKSSILSVLVPIVLHTHNPEKKSRLVHICLQLLLARMEYTPGARPFIGIGFFLRRVTIKTKTKIIRLNAAQVSSVLPGFPAGRVLHDGDLILAVNSHPFPRTATINSFRMMLNTCVPGTRVTLLVMRGRQLHVFHIPLVGMPVSSIALVQLMQQRNAVANQFAHRYWPMTRSIILAPERLRH